MPYRVAFIPACRSFFGVIMADVLSNVVALIALIFVGYIVFRSFLED